MQESIALKLLIATSEEDFSLDEFIIRLKEFAMTEGLSGIAAFFLGLLDQLLQVRRLTGRGCAGHLSALRRKASGGQASGAAPARTGIGEVKFSWRRLICSSCKKTHVPLRDFLRLDRWQSKSNELQRWPWRCSANSPTSAAPIIF